MGGAFPIRIQTMANTDTNAIDASVQQSVEVVKAGAELLRFTTQGVKEATALGQIHAQLRAQGIEIPLVADVHFNPKVAEVAAQLVEKVRINPGHFVASQEGEYSDESYDEELSRIEEKLFPLLAICKEHCTALRIGANPGSLLPSIVPR